LDCRNVPRLVLGVVLMNQRTAASRGGTSHASAAVISVEQRSRVGAPPPAGCVTAKTKMNHRCSMDNVVHLRSCAVRCVAALIQAWTRDGSPGWGCQCFHGLSTVVLTLAWVTVVSGLQAPDIRGVIVRVAQ